MDAHSLRCKPATVASVYQFGVLVPGKKEIVRKHKMNTVILNITTNPASTLARVWWWHTLN
jgi:hypothetical protein